MTSRPLLFDASHTSHTSAQTGIQRVCRALFAELAARGAAEPVCYDPHLEGWRPLEPDEREILLDRSGGAGKSRGARWTLRQKFRGASRRWLGRKPALPPSSGAICPELFSASVARRLPGLFAATPGPRVAVFYDAIPLKFPEFTPRGTVARFPGYLRELAQFDGVAAISQDSADTLRAYWRWVGLDAAPPVHALPLAVDAPTLVNAGATLPAAARPCVLCVCTIEGRKNHRALLDACDELWRAGLDFELHLIGMARADTAGDALARIAELQAAGRPLRYAGSVPDAALQAAYRECAFTVYPSISEGFGMPVLESIQHGKPCVCLGSGALGESTRDGGCVALARVDAPALAAAIRQLLARPEELAALARAARARKLKSWATYASEFTDWMRTLPRRA